MRYIIYVHIKQVLPCVYYAVTVCTCVQLHFFIVVNQKLVALRHGPKKNLYTFVQNNRVNERKGEKRPRVSESKEHGKFSGFLFYFTFRIFLVGKKGKHVLRENAAIKGISVW